MVPDHLDFGFCPCQETALKTFSVVNNGEVGAGCQIATLARARMYTQVHSNAHVRLRAHT
eukprot:4952289-Pleurochrysis_carterae.AAC.1